MFKVLPLGWKLICRNKRTFFHIKRLKWIVMIILNSNIERQKWRVVVFESWSQIHWQSTRSVQKLPEASVPEASRSQSWDRVRRSCWSNSVLCSEPLIHINSHTPHFTLWLRCIHIMHIIYRQKSWSGIRMEAGKSESVHHALRWLTAFSRLALMRDRVRSRHESPKCQSGIIRCSDMWMTCTRFPDSFILCCFSSRV